MLSPTRKVSHEERLDVARQISDLLLEKYQGSVLAVCVSGSVAKQLDRPYSDLEILCVVSDGLEIAHKYYVYNGLLVEIDYPQESNFLKAAREVGWDWPIQADQYRNRIVLFERNGWLGKLVEAVAENDKADLKEALRTAMIAVIESLDAVRNAHLKVDLWDMRTRSFYMAWDVAKVVFLLNRRWVLTTSWFWKQTLECPVKPDDFRELVQTLMGMTTAAPEEVMWAAERLCEEIMGLVGSRKIFVETEKLSV